MSASEELKSKRIVFMGTPDFSVPVLERLVSDGCNVVGVVTGQDKPAGRGYALTPPPVKVAADRLAVPVFQPESLKKVFFEQTLRELNPDIIVVVAFGKLLYPYILNYPEYGCINIHGSLLPKYRGAAPMQRVLIDGESETGVTFMKMAKGLDTGDMLYKISAPITDEDNFESIHDRLSAMGSENITAVLDMLISGKLTPVAQDEALSNYAEKIESGDCVIDFTKSARTVFNQIRGLSPIPLAYTYLNGKRVKIISAKAEKEGKVKADAVPGEVTDTSGGRISVCCADGIISVLSLQMEGKRRMSAADFVNGRNIKIGDIFGGEK